MASPVSYPGEARVAAEEIARAQLYHLLARLLGAPPAAAELRMVAGLDGDASALGSAIANLARQSAGAEPARVAEEFHDLFIGLGRGELVPYASYYLTGFLHEKPLARLRQDMARLGIARSPDTREPEDHIAALLEMMAGLIDGAFGQPRALAQQKAFYDAHVRPWGRVFFGDLEVARSAALYAAVGALGKRFLDIEEAAFAMD